MQKPETKFINKIHKALPKKIYRWKINDSYTSGVPDCYYSGVGDDLFAEYKWYPNDKHTIDLTSGKKPKLTRLQQHWLNGRLCEGRHPWVIIGSPGGGIILAGGEWNDKIITPGRFLTVCQVVEAIEIRCDTRRYSITSDYNVQKALT